MSDTPPQPQSKDAARAWLAWAARHHHQAGCQCHGCLAARALLEGELRDESPPPGRS